MLTLHRLDAGYRLLYTGVLLFMTAGTVAHTAHQAARAGIRPAAVVAWYRGNENDRAAEALLFPRSAEEVLDDAWLAVTTYTLALLIFGGILYRSDAAPAVRATLIGGYTAAALVAGAAPPLVRWVSPGFAAVETAVLVLLPALALTMTTVALRDLWWRAEEGPRFDRTTVL